MIKWQENKIFKLPFIVIGNWNFSTYEKFSHCDYVSADTETKLYYKDELLSEQKAYAFTTICVLHHLAPYNLYNSYAFCSDNNSSL